MKKNFFSKVFRTSKQKENVVSQEKNPIDPLEEVQIGWYVFQGGKFSSNPRDYPNLQGVVAWKNTNPALCPEYHGLILTLENVCLCWALENIKTNVTQENCGKDNTRNLLDWAEKRGGHCPAAKYCSCYARRGVEKGTAFLPSLRQLDDILLNKDYLNVCLKRVHAPLLEGRFWSSTEYSADSASCINATSGQWETSSKGTRLQVRCVLAF